MAYRYLNFFETSLAQAISDSQLTLVVPSADAALLDLPTTATGSTNKYRCVLWDNVNDPEIIDLTEKNGTVITIERAKEGTVAQAWVGGALLTNSPTKEFWETIVTSTYATIFVAESVAYNAGVYTVTLDGVTAVPSLTAGEIVQFDIPTTNAIEGITLVVQNQDSPVDTTVAKNLKWPNGSSFQIGEFESGYTVTVQYNGDEWVPTSLSSSMLRAKQQNTGPLGLPNWEKNSRLEQWDAGTSISSPASLAAICNGWYVQHDGTIGTYSVSRQSFTLGQTTVLGNPKYFGRWDHTSAGSGSTLRSLRTKLPDVSFRSGEKVNRRVWMKADSARNVTAKIIQHFGTGGSPSADVEVVTATWALTTSWQAFDITATLNSVSGKTLGSNNDDGLILAIDLPVNTNMTIDFAMPQFEPGNFASKHNGMLPLAPQYGGLGASFDTVANLITLRALSSITNLTQLAGLTQSQGYGIISNGNSLVSEPLSDYSATINGDFEIWQRGTSFASAADGTYNADASWVYGKIGAMVHDISRSTDVPTVAAAGRLYNYSALIDCTTVDSSLASTDVCVFIKNIEGFFFLPLAQRTFTLCFWVKGTKTGVHCVAFRNSGADRSYVAEYTINASDTWEFKTITVSASPSAGTWNYETGVGLSVRWTLAAGSAFQTTAGAWQTGNFCATANQVNACDNTANNFRITGVRLVAGSVAKPLVQRPYAQELSLCHRYYVTVEGVATTGGMTTNPTFSFPVEMRATPTLSVSYSSGTGAVFTNVATSPTSGRRAIFQSANHSANVYFVCACSAEL